MKVGPALIEKPDLSRFALIGDVHGCFAELSELLEKLQPYLTDNRTLVFVGDFVDRGPEPVQVLRQLMELHRQGKALAVKGNHDEKLYRWLNGKNVQLWHGLDYTTEQLKKETPAFREETRQFIGALPFQLVLDRDQLLVAHAGLSERLQKQNTDAMRSFALYGDTTGKKDQFGLPERRDWARAYRGKRLVVYGHTPTATPYWQNNTVNIDTGCAFGGNLTALLYPERETLQVKAAKQYAQPGRPFLEVAG